MDSIAGGQIQGARENQQDAFSYLEWNQNHYLMILADGIGGATGGEIASNIAVREFKNTFISDVSISSIRDRLIHSLQAVNDALYMEKKEHQTISALGGTTLTGAVVIEHKFYWISVGDSPLWLIRGQSITRLNEDHSIGAVLDMRAQAGEISWEVAKKSNERNNLLSAVLGADIDYVDAPADPIQLYPGDVLICASDGIETCAPEEILQIVTAGHPSPLDIVEVLLESVAAMNRPKQDNASLIVYRYR
ncbi:MAG: protein phosphatase 2C domain-containing protein [Bacteroidetes bacterium]|nr:protein phosphatase 2C domain-containing protein [Bacteroidota bacterium]